jgi:hypothetical protein
MTQNNIASPRSRPDSIAVSHWCAAARNRHRSLAAHRA